MPSIIKRIFIVIIGTVVIMCTCSLVLEYYNVSTSGLQLQSIAKIAARQACVFYGQETYKRSDYTDINTRDLYTNKGELAVSGTFYQGGSPEAIYNELYGPGSNFLDSNGDVRKKLMGKWENLDILVQKNDGLGIGEYYAESLVTPLNIGIPYIDIDVVNKIFKWNLAAILNNGQYSGNNALNIHRDDNGKYVLYKGFKVYVDKAKITDIEYIVLDITTPSGKADLKEYTNMDADILLRNGASTDERKNICLAGIEYSVPIQYAGITPVKKLAEYGWNSRVKGLHNNKDAGRNDLGTWNDESFSNLEAGGLKGSKASGILPVPGDLVYYIVR